MGESVHLNILDPEIVRIVEQDRPEKGHHQFKNIYPDTVVSEIYQLRTKYNFSAKEVMRYMREKYGTSPSESYIFKIVKFFQNRFPKQDFFGAIVPESDLYPISTKRPTKTPEKADLDPENTPTQKAVKRVDPPDENEPGLGVEENSENVFESTKPEIEDIPIKKEEKAQEMKPLNEPSPTNIEVNAPKKMAPEKRIRK